MFVSRGRGRVVLLVLILVLAGSPWVQRPLLDFYIRKFYVELSDDDFLRWLTEAAMSPGWGFDPDRYGNTAALVVNDLGALALVVGLALFAGRLTRGKSGWPRCLVGGVLIAALTSFLWWGMHAAFVDDVTLAPADVLVKNLLRSALIFGLAAGVLLALLTAGPPKLSGLSGAVGVSRASATRSVRSGGASTASFRRRREGGGPAMTTTPAHMPVGSTPGDVTRYLCAAAYIDEGFADRVVEEVLADEAGAVAPSPEVDLVKVVRHCLAAQELRHQRDLRLTAAYAVVALLAPLWLLFVVVLLSITGRARSRPSLATRGQHQPSGRVLVSIGAVALMAVILAFWFAVLFASLPMPGFISWLLGAYLAGVPAVLASVGAAAYAYVTVVRHDLATDQLLRTTMTRETFARQPRPTVPKRKWIADRLAAVKAARDGNVTLYSGFTPWVGYAATSAKWPLTVPLLPAEDRAGVNGHPTAPRPFTVADIVGQVRGKLQAVAARDGADAAESLGSLVIEDRVFASGTTVGDDERFISPTSLAPLARLSDEAVEQVMRHPSGAVRHYLAIHVPLWGGDVVPSVFLHFSTVGQSLHVHIDTHVLGPVHAAYHVVDRMRGPLTAEARLGLLMNALLHTGGSFFAAPFRAWHHARSEARHSRRMADELKAVEQDPVYDYGARVSIREMALSPDYHNYFQVLDAERITALVQRHTLAAVREFLDAHGYDTTDFRAQQQTILNQGVIQQGGTSIIGNQAIGAGATANQNIPQQSGAGALSPAGGGGPTK